MGQENAINQPFWRQIRQLGKDYSFWLPNFLIILTFGFLGLLAITHRGVGGRIIITLFQEKFSQKRPYEGLFTQVSEVLWSLVAAVLWFTFSYIKMQRPPVAKRIRRGIFCLGLLVTVLLLDDSFRFTLMLSFYFGIPKSLMYGFYTVYLGAYVWLFRDFLMNTPYFLLILSISLLGVSSLIDVIHVGGQGLPVMLEDGTKFLGILNLLIYCWKVGFEIIRQSNVVRFQPDS